MINLKLNGITLQFDDATALIDLMTAEDRAQVIESMSCYDDVVKHVADQICSPHGWTENGFSGSSRCGEDKYAGEGTALDKARYQVAMSASESAAEYMASQAEIIINQKKQIDVLDSKLNQLQNPRSNY